MARALRKDSANTQRESNKVGCWGGRCDALDHASGLVGRTDRDTLLHMNERPPERVVIRGVLPELECGRFAVKRVVGESVIVEADIFADGHDAIVPAVRYRHEGDEPWSELPMTPLGNDHWQAKFTVGKLGQYIYTITAWIDSFQTWYTDFLKRG